MPLSTSATQAKRGPTAVLIPKGEAGSQAASVALCHQITTLDRTKLSQQLGQLSAPHLSAVERGVVAALDLSQYFGAEKTRAWLLSEPPALEFQRPVDLLGTARGCERVKVLLGQIAFGIY